MKKNLLPMWHTVHFSLFFQSCNSSLPGSTTQYLSIKIAGHPHGKLRPDNKHSRSDSKMMYMIKSITGNDKPGESFITVWDTTLGSIPTNSIRYPGIGTDYSIIWEQVSNPEIGDTLRGNQTTNIRFPEAGAYRVKVTPEKGTFSGFSMENFREETKDYDNALKLKTVEQWGSIKWTYLEGGFSTCRNLDIIARDVPNLGQVRSLRRTFSACVQLIYNHTINKWNVSNVANMDKLFFAAVNFNQPIGQWDVGAVTDMRELFAEARSFNQPIGDWQVGNVKTMQELFSGASRFNHPLLQWDVGRVTNMSGMFAEARSFNRALNRWNVSRVTDMSEMFWGAAAFNQPLAKWNLRNIEKMKSMFFQSGMNSINHDKALASWAKQKKIARIL